jgi:hypothetical protein
MTVKFPLLVSNATLNESGDGVAIALLSGLVSALAAPPLPPDSDRQDGPSSAIERAIDARIRRRGMNDNGMA